jgi:integrase
LLLDIRRNLPAGARGARHRSDLLLDVVGVTAQRPKVMMFGDEQAPSWRRRRQMFYAFEAAVRRAGIPYGRNVRGGLTYHDLRHTFATKLRAAGVHEYDIADLLGHSTTSTERRDTKVTRGYSHAVPSRLMEAVESICNLNVLEFRRKQA